MSKSQLTVENYSIPSASLGKSNPLPDLTAKRDLHAQIQIDENSITPEESKYMGWGHANGILPYLMQDQYDRKKKPREWKAVILENDHIRAVFMPELGGRLWSLTDKHAGRELLHKNPVFQPANLALRNAWFSGGVEWNIGMVGHGPFTADDMFAETLALDDGTPVLRMFQYERVRRLVYRIEAILPDDSRHLYVRVRIDNTSTEDTAVYWWSNIAVDERKDVRVLVPAETGYRWVYGGILTKEPVPYQTFEKDELSSGDASKPGSEDGNPRAADISYPARIPQTTDCFFGLPDGQRRWIAAVGGDGYGLIQASTDVLKGRKLFAWGMRDGARNWQAFLSEPGQAYLEIQAGLAPTQLEHLPMKGGQTLSWMEAYGPISTPGEVVHDKDWHAAIGGIEKALEAVCSPAKIEEMLRIAERELDGKKGKFVHAGMGWGRVQQALLGDQFDSRGLAFPASCMRKPERGWLSLVRDGFLPCPDPLAEPDSYQIGDEWETLLKKAIDSGSSDHWYAWYQLGVTVAYKSDFDRAKTCFKTSLNRAPSPWALRCLAKLSQLDNDHPAAAKLLLEAVAMKPQRNLAVEAVESLCKAGRFADAVALVSGLPKSVRKLGRIRLFYIEALIELGKLTKAEQLLRKIEPVDLREGETILTDLWIRLCALQRVRDNGAPMGEALLEQVKLECPPPAHLDFRMKG